MRTSDTFGKTLGVQSADGEAYKRGSADRLFHFFLSSGNLIDVPWSLSRSAAHRSIPVIRLRFSKIDLPSTKAIAPLTVLISGTASPKHELLNQKRGEDCSKIRKALTNHTFEFMTGKCLSFPFRCPDCPTSYLSPPAHRLPP
jgi:hypothetical protein